jgi:Phosphotriesterase family
VGSRRSSIRPCSGSAAASRASSGSTPQSTCTSWWRRASTPSSSSPTSWPTALEFLTAGDSNDLDYLRAIADQGAWLGCDRYGIEHFNPTPDRIRTLLALIAEGYSDRIHLSHDGACFYDFLAHNPFFADEHPDLLRIHKSLLPALREGGVDEEQIARMMVDNPRRFLAGT